MKKLNKSTIENARELRQNGKSFEFIAKALSISRETVTKYTNDIYLSKEKKFQMKSDSATKYQYNTNILLQENELSYYLLGAYVTDGHITKNNNSYCSVLTSKDKDWLENIRDIICPNKSLTKRKNAFSLDISNKQISEWLLSHGCTQKKSLTVQFPSVPQKYLKDFIRGCWDGDGCICVYNAKGRNYPRRYGYLASASKAFILSLSTKLNEQNITNSIHKLKLTGGIINGRKIIPKHNLFKVHLSDLNVLKLINYIYYENCFSMPRKKQVADKVINIQKQIVATKSL